MKDKQELARKTREMSNPGRSSEARESGEILERSLVWLERKGQEKKSLDWFGQSLKSKAQELGLHPVGPQEPLKDSEQSMI